MSDSDEIEIAGSPDVPRKVKRIKVDGSQTRWIVIVLVGYFFLAEGFTKTCFGQINNIVAQFFDVSIEYVDWLTVAPSVSSAVSLFLMTWMTASGLVGLRAWCLTSAMFIIASFACTVIGVLSRGLFPLAVLGQVLAGTANAINFSLAPLMASSWFSEREAPTAIALTYAGLNAGNIIGFLIPANMLPKTNRTIQETEIGLSAESPESEWAAKVSISLTAIFSSFLAASVLFGFFSFLFILDTPTQLQLPSLSEPDVCSSASRGIETHSSSFQVRIKRAKSATKGTIIAWFKASKTLLTMKNFLVLAIPYSIMLPLCLIWFVLMSDVLRSTNFTKVTFLDVTSSATVSSANESTTVSYESTSNVVAGYIMSMYCVGGLVGGALTGKLAQLFKYRYATITSIAAWGVVGSSVGISMAFRMGSLETAFVFNFLFGLFVPVAVTPLVAMVIERVTTVERLTVGSWLAIFSSINAALLPLCGRLCFENFGPIAPGIFQISIAVLVAIFLLFVKKLLG